MEQSALGTDAAKTGQEIVGYLNFSSGAADPRFLQNVNRLFEVLDADSLRGCPADRVEPTWKALHRSVAKTLQELHGRSEAFRQIEQAEAVLGLVFEKTLPGLPPVPRDLLFHQSEEIAFSAAVHRPRVRGGAAAGRSVGPDRANRPGRDRTSERLPRPPPVAVLRTQQKIQPYAHEWVRPIPLFIRGAGVGVGRYHDLVSRALAILDDIDPDVAIRVDVRPGAAGRAGRRSAGLRLRPSGEQAAELSLRPMGPGQAGQRGPLPPLRRCSRCRWTPCWNASSIAAACPTRRCSSKRRPCWRARS